MRKYYTLIFLSCIFTIAQAKAISITIFTDKLHPIDTTNIHVRYFEIDTVQQLINQLNQSLQGLTKAEARVKAQTFLNEHKEELSNSAEGLARAEQLKVTQFPAIVFDNKAVIYGQTRLTEALAEYEQWQRTAH